MVTEKLMQKYEDVRSAGHYNMLSEDALNAVGCSKEDYLDMVKHYTHYMETFNITRK